MQQRDETVFVPIGKNDTFSFLCHPGIRCFNQCCAKLKLTLTPYDIVRMKNVLNMDSDSFLERYTRIFEDNHRAFPGVRLRMLENERNSCPFLTPGGCGIYRDRPGACRLYPMGRAAAHHGAGGSKVSEKYFLVRETHCLGFNESLRWMPSDWMSHEGLGAYLAFNDQWQKIVTHRGSPGRAGDLDRKRSMFFMASYNLDRFRDFLFASSFFRRFHVDENVRESIREDDEALLRFAIDWLKFSLLGEKTLLPLS